jgi:hypothetical protein
MTSSVLLPFFSIPSAWRLAVLEFLFTSFEACVLPVFLFAWLKQLSILQCSRIRVLSSSTFGITAVNVRKTRAFSSKEKEMYLLFTVFTYLLHGALSFFRSYPVLQVVKKFPAFMEPESSLSYSQVPASCPYPERATSVPTNPSLFLKIPLNIILSSTSDSPNGLFPSEFPTNTLCTPLPSPYALHAQPI